MTDYDVLHFDGVSPESLGIPSKAVLGFLEELEENGLCMHGFLMARKGQVFAEGYYAPFKVDTPHRMYSISKSFTSAAIGLLQEEGKLSLRDKIWDYFPDKLSGNKVHPYIAKTTIRDLLCMAAPHNSTTYKQAEEEDWVKTFFTVKPMHYPGTCFVYDTSATHVLSALVERVSQKSLLEYLKEKVLTPLNCSPDIKWLTCPMGICQGGTGLICTLRDVAKFAYTCMKEGRYAGMQLIPEDYIKEATSFQISTPLQPSVEEQYGYGYHFWRCRNNGFSLYGMGGQLAVCLPDKDFMLVTEGDTLFVPNGVQGIYNAFWHFIYPYLEDKEIISPQYNLRQEELKDRIKGLEIKAVRKKGFSKFSENIQDRASENAQEEEQGDIQGEILKNIPEKASENILGEAYGNVFSSAIKEIEGVSYYFEENSMGISSCCLVLEPEKERGSFLFELKGEEKQIDFGFGYMIEQVFPGTDYKCVSSAAWIEDNVLHMRTYVIDECYASLNMTMTFLDNYITLAMRRTSEDFLRRYEGCISGKGIYTQSFS